MPEMLLRFDRNTRGRDFVVGDIHGCFDQLRQALDQAAFDPATDRLFSVGDLIDRGPRSAEALEWLAKPWFHACLGNHEEMALLSPHDPDMLLNWVLLNGGAWFLTLDAGTQQRYLSAFRELPLVMEIATVHGRVGIVHADIPEGMKWQGFLDALAAGDAATIEAVLWGRLRAEGCVDTPVAGIDRVVCGHTITSDFRVHRHANVWCIDTGAFLAAEGGQLTVLPLDSLFEEDEAMAGPDNKP